MWNRSATCVRFVVTECSGITTLEKVYGTYLIEVTRSGEGCDPDVNLLAEYFADELRLAREEAGMTQEQLAAAVFKSKSTVAMVESCQRTPTEDFAADLDKILDTNGRFERMRRRLLRAEVTPEWFRPWMDFEQQATALRSFEPTVVPGLLQIEDYARALTGSDEATAARIERQGLLTRENPPELISIVNESVLHRQVGGRDVMHRQLLHLADPPGRVRVQVLPADADTYSGIDGSFILATVEGTSCVYVHTPARGFVLEDAGVLSGVSGRWETLRGEALNRRQSRDLIVKVAETWQTTIT
jgi:transcriptional regulator with XRE-family HTH domain